MSPQIKKFTKKHTFLHLSFYSADLMPVIGCMYVAKHTPNIHQHTPCWKNGVYTASPKSQRRVLLKTKTEKTPSF